MLLDLGPAPFPPSVPRASSAVCCSAFRDAARRLVRHAGTLRLLNGAAVHAFLHGRKAEHPILAGRAQWASVTCMASAY